MHPTDHGGQGAGNVQRGFLSGGPPGGTSPDAGVSAETEASVASTGFCWALPLILLIWALWGLHVLLFGFCWVTIPY